MKDDPTCPLCRGKQTEEHVLSSCKVALSQEIGTRGFVGTSAYNCLSKFSNNGHRRTKCPEVLVEAEPTLDAAVHVSNNTCLEISSFFGREHETETSRLFVETSELSFVFYSLVLRQRLCWIRRGGHYVTTHNSTDCCRANHKASLVTQIIRPTCNWMAHSKNNCDISPSCRLLQVASRSVWSTLRVDTLRSML
ncbi:reverse transcriptase [Plakobranchus ocellatus]|uniref:Reverse transcriptase n=1 Tax=Plakobranchus ocellatus TaxID=259542 RepID=A0AAV4AAU4_9GAST|nr:reverse transcriptase [Plakobranchus ocellatus]